MPPESEAPKPLPGAMRAATVLSDNGWLSSDMCGGVLPGAATIIARESGVPAVVGCGTATQVFRDGDRLLVDAEAGTVRLLS